ncbi:M23 family metallopeptidase [Megalodesulfovibrio paquesii]
MRGKKRLGLVACLAFVLFYGVPLPTISMFSLFEDPIHEPFAEGEVVTLPEPEPPHGAHLSLNDPQALQFGETDEPAGGAACPAPPQGHEIEQQLGENTTARLAHSAQSPADPNAPCIIEDMVNAGDTLSSLLDPYIVPGELEKFTSACKGQFNVASLRVGKTYRITTVAGSLQQFVYEEDDKGLLIVERKGDEFVAGHVPLVYDVKTEALVGEIRSSLFGAVERMGEKPEIAVRLAEIFSCDVDFLRDIREGDSFRVLIKKRFLDSALVGYSDVLAAQFVNSGKSFYGFLFHDETGKAEYYDAEGNSLKKSFLKAPLAFTRVTSGFSMARKHPVLGIVRPHPAVDYGAPKGTPVMAVADGVVDFNGWGNGAGNYIKLKHQSGYESMYLHLSRFANGLKKGARVRQGEVIGYVGATGIATGPHLDFRMKKDGNWINPTNLVNIKGGSLPAKYMKEFKKVVAAHLDMLKDAMSAQAPAGVATSQQAAGYSVASARP